MGIRNRFSSIRATVDAAIQRRNEKNLQVIASRGKERERDFNSLDFYEQIEANRELSRIGFRIARLSAALSLLTLFAFSERGTTFHVGHIVAQTMIALIGWSSFKSSRIQMRTAWRDFYMHRIVPEGMVMQAKYPDLFPLFRSSGYSENPEIYELLKRKPAGT